MRYSLACAALLGLFAPLALARPITVNSNIEPSATGIRVQAVVVDPIGVNGSDTGVETRALFIKEVRAAILIRDENILNGLEVKKRQLTAQQAYGLGLPFGYENPPTTDPEGPWFGLVWPYRDQYDYFPDEFDPLADDVGTFFESQPGVYGFVDVDGIARGGPTDPEPAGGSPNLLDRGLTGNGVPQSGQNPGPATYFLFDVNALVGPFDRFIEVRVIGASCVVVQREQPNGPYSEIIVQIPDFTTMIQLPEPGFAAAGALLAALALRRTRRTT